MNFSVDHKCIILKRLRRDQEILEDRIPYFGWDDEEVAPRGWVFRGMLDRFGASHFASCWRVVGGIAVECVIL
jgi:hypothetical protein